VVNIIKITVININVGNEVMCLLTVDWLAPVPEDIHKAMCRYCLTELVAQMSALKKHARTVRHRKLSASGGRLRYTAGPPQNSTCL